MFTGIVEEMGTVQTLQRSENTARLSVRASLVRDDLHVGDSLATNGVCLTVEKIEPEKLWLWMMPETLKSTTLGRLQPGQQVNLERALRLDNRLGGHIVSGHVDGVGKLRNISGVGEERVLTFTLPGTLARFVSPKGSVAIDGISLTVVDADTESFSVSLIRHTLSVTTLSTLSIGDEVNIEVDLLARYLERLLLNRDIPAGLTLERLSELGY